MEFENKVVLITGAAGGIGKEVIKKFAEAKAKLSLVDLDRNKIDELISELNLNRENVLSIEANVSQESDVVRYVQLTKEKFNHIDVFFNNAGIEGVNAPIYEYPSEIFEKLMQINVNGVFYGLKHVLKEMVKQNSGSIINTASVGGLKGTAGLSAYIGSKHGVIGLTKAAALDVAKLGIRVNAICPSPVNTRMMRSIEENFNRENIEEAKKMFENNIPIGRYAEASEVADLVAFLASDKSKFMTGGSYTIDGGLTIR